MGSFLVCFKSFFCCVGSDLDTMDAATFQGRPTYVHWMESVVAAIIHLFHGNQFIRNVKIGPIKI